MVLQRYKIGNVVITIGIIIKHSNNNYKAVVGWGPVISLAKHRLISGLGLGLGLGLPAHTGTSASTQPLGTSAGQHALDRHGDDVEITYGCHSESERHDRLVEDSL